MAKNVSGKGLIYNYTLEVFGFTFFDFNVFAFEVLKRGIESFEVSHSMVFAS